MNLLLCLALRVPTVVVKIHPLFVSSFPAHRSGPASSPLVHLRVVLQGDRLGQHAPGLLGPIDGDQHPHHGE